MYLLPGREHLRNKKAHQWVGQSETRRHSSQSDCHIILDITCYRRANEALESRFPKLLRLSESVEKLSRNRDPNLNQNKHVYAVFCRPEAAGDVISNGNVKTVEGYVVLNFETASVSSFRENQNQPIA